ncbi:hypothetical protein SAMN04488135_101302 [Pollutimonas bauzanensis]|uniref:Uncharacterized protein n=1 Tax=Pollutimonas bauzanensis TaxID=658167 RepID=A0A1M5MS08_9BURK|nr:hypothetical protein SAMN04488135_101302 [Pollutimonas bauzanensis]
MIARHSAAATFPVLFSGALIMDTLRFRSCFAYGTGIFANALIGGRKGNAFDGRLCNQQAVEWIFMDGGQAVDRNNMFTCDSQLLIAIIKQRTAQQARIDPCTVSSQALSEQTQRNRRALVKKEGTHFQCAIVAGALAHAPGGQRRDAQRAAIYGRRGGRRLLPCLLRRRVGGSCDAGESFQATWPPAGLDEIGILPVGFAIIEFPAHWHGNR